MIINNRSYWSILKTTRTTVSVQPREDKPILVFRVKNVFDLGLGEQTALLERVGVIIQSYHHDPQCDLLVPERIDNLKLVYAGKNNRLGRSVRELIDSPALPIKSVEDIVPEVIMPGDIMTFKKSPYSEDTVLVRAQRPVLKYKYRKLGSSYAL